MKHDNQAFSAAQAYRSANATEVDDRVKRFTGMVHRAAWHIYGVGREGLEVEDLVQAGMIALTECAIRHTGSSEDGFAAYAKMRVRGAMFDQIRKLMLDSRRKVKRRKHYEEAVSALVQELGGTPTRAQIAQKLGCSEVELAEFESSATRLTSLDEAYDENNTAFADTAPDPFDMLVGMEDRDRLIAAIQELPERLQLVLQLFFVEELNLTEIAQVLDVSVPRVHQLRGSALKKLRDMMDLGDPLEF